jgi:MscS family membrane protein
MSELNKFRALSISGAHNKILLACLLTFLVLAPATLAAQNQTLETRAEDPDVVEGVALKDNLGRDTPYNSFVGFLLASEQFDYEEAVNFMDLRNLPFDTRQLGGAELARELDFIIQRGMRVDLDQLSRKVSGQIVDGLPDYRDELGRIVAEEGEQILFMQKVPGPDDGFIWKISNASIAHVPELYDFFSYPEWIESIRARLPSDPSFLGIELFKWVIVLGVAAIAFPIFWLIGFALSWLISKPGSPLHHPTRKLFTRPLTILAVMVVTGGILQELGLGARAQLIVNTQTLSTLLCVWIIFSLVDLFRARRREKFLAQGRADAHILGRPMANALKLVTLLGAVLFWMNNAGINITTLLTGLGIGGLALALALQKPIEDLLGAVSLYSQQPMQTGDLCKYGTILGRIEEIGLRTTRIRTLNDTLVSIPNCIIAHGAIENYSARKKMLYHPNLPLRYDTSLKQIQTIIDGIDAMAREHEKVITDSVRIRFTAYTENALIIKARIYVDESNFSSYLAVVNDLNMLIMKVVQDAGAHFAQGAKTIMLENGLHLTPEAEGSPINLA